MPGKITAGPALKVGMEDARVPLVRQRLGVSGDGDVFDKPLSDAVKKFQQDNNLKAAGTLDAPTVEALNQSRRETGDFGPDAATCGGPFRRRRGADIRRAGHRSCRTRHVAIKTGGDRG